MHRLIAVVAFVCVAISACTTPSTGAPRPSVAEQRPAEPQVASFTPSPTSTIDTRPEVRPAAPPAAILVDDDGSGIRLRARPIDPLTLADVPGYAPISFEHHYKAAVIPGGTTIVAVMWPGANGNSGARLHVIDAARWLDRAIDTKIDGYTTALRPDATGASVYWAQPVSGSPAETTSALWKLDVASGSTRELARLPANLYARDVQTFGGRVAVYAEPGASVIVNGQRRDVPTVFVVDPSGPRIVASIPLPVRAGSYQDDAPANADEPWRQIEPGLAWDLPRGRLFVADAQSDGIFRVDLIGGTIAGPFDPKPRRSLVDVLWALAGGAVAEAKMQSADRREAAVTSDGKRLYVSGVRSTFAKGSDGKYHENIVPLDLRAVDTDDMTEIARGNAATTPLWLTPDGASLVYATNRYDSSAEGYTTKNDYALHVADPTTLRDRATQALSGSPWLAAFDPARHLVYVSWTAIVGGTLSRATILAVDSRDGRLVATRDMDRHFADVLVVGPR
jgi:hypothetical protein